ncbi:hypothetical protein SLH47_13120 [Cognatiyoonia sp. IB215182]|nr:hypothetical protein [Cognatiyoonia sp. IB215182]MDX8353311.1 hypothetical protein [Cognatiyoonia sp. IB215182]
MASSQKDRMIAGKACAPGNFELVTVRKRAQALMQSSGQTAWSPAMWRPEER